MVKRDRSFFKKQPSNSKLKKLVPPVDYHFQLVPVLSPIKSNYKQERTHIVAPSHASTSKKVPKIC